jgi:CHAT domain-containing protein
VPIHAAGIYEGSNQECCSDYVVSSYTPTLAALIQARKSQSTFNPQQMRVLAIAAQHAAEGSNMPPLQNAVPETRCVIDIATMAGASSSADADTATQAELLAMFQSSQVIHLACHGIQDKAEPHKSRFCLSTGDLTVSELTQMDLKGAFLAYLSACETAKGDQKHADEVVHLAASMLFAGFQSVVATMW